MKQRKISSAAKPAVKEGKPRKPPLPPLKRRVTGNDVAVIKQKLNLSPEEAALLGGFHRATLYRQWDQKKGPAYFNIGTRRLIRRKDFDAWLAQQRDAA
jgi:excisionase family DNA binding protein